MHDFDDCDHLHLKGIHTFYETKVDQRLREHSLDVVKEWIDINSHRFTIPSSDWGQHLLASLEMVIAMAEHYAGTNGESGPTPLFRRPFMVEAVSYFPVVSDPYITTFTNLEDARDHAVTEKEENSRFVTVYERDASGEWVEV